MNGILVVPGRLVQPRLDGLGQIDPEQARFMTQARGVFEGIEKFQPFKLVADINEAVQEGRAAIGEMRIHLGDISPTLKTAMVVTAVSTGTIALLLLLDFLGLNPFRSG